MTRRGKRDRAGFTLVELLIVTAILAIVALAAQPVMTSSFDSSDLTAAASDVATALRYAQALAVSSGMPCRVTVDPDSDLVKVEQVVPAAAFFNPGAVTIDKAVVESSAYQMVDHPLKPGFPYCVRLGGNPGYGGVDATSVVFGAGHAVVFDAYGVPSSGGTITLSRGGRSTVLTVDGCSGLVTQQ